MFSPSGLGGHLQEAGVMSLEKVNLRDDIKNDKIPFQSPAYFSYLDFQHNSIMTVSLPLVQYVAAAAQN